jgi:hypothetical protein
MIIDTDDQVELQPDSDAQSPSLREQQAHYSYRIFASRLHDGDDPIPTRAVVAGGVTPDMQRVWKSRPASARLDLNRQLASAVCRIPGKAPQYSTIFSSKSVGTAESPPAPSFYVVYRLHNELADWKMVQSSTANPRAASEQVAADGDEEELALWRF